MEDAGSTAFERSLGTEAPARHGSAVRGFVFRLGFAYWMLFCVYVFHTEVGSFRWIDKLAAPVWSALEVWVGRACSASPEIFPPRKMAVATRRRTGSRCCVSPASR